MGTQDDAPLEQLVRGGLKGLHLELRVVHAGIVVSVAALHHQNVDRDIEIARVLKHCVARRVSDQIRRTRDLLASLESRAADPSGTD